MVVGCGTWLGAWFDCVIIQAKMVQGGTDGVQDMEDREGRMGREKKGRWGETRLFWGLVMLLETSPTPSARLPGLPYALIAG